MEAKTINKYSKKTYSQLHRTAKEWCHKYIRLRDTDDYGNGNCIVTGKPLKYGNEQAQAGHYYAAGKYKVLEFNEDNIHLQSKQDNYYGHDFATYSRNLIDKIGQPHLGHFSVLGESFNGSTGRSFSSANMTSSHFLISFLMTSICFLFIL